jgi:hypothetical protein
MAKGKEFKKPSFKSKGRFQVKEAARPSRHDDSLKPIFSFHHMPYGKPYCLTTCENAVKSSVAVTLVRLSQLTWTAIYLEPKDGLGCEKIPRHQFKVAMPTVITPEVPILVFRHSGGGRIAGYREENIYHILLIGKDLYDH